MTNKIKEERREEFTALVDTIGLLPTGLLAQAHSPEIQWVECQCLDHTHSIRFSIYDFFLDDEYPPDLVIELTPTLVNKGILYRLKYALMILFGKAPDSIYVETLAQGDSVRKLHKLLGSYLERLD